MSDTKTTTDHAVIRKWAEARGAHPSSVHGTGKKREPGILRLDFEPKDKALDEISWDEFFAKFDKERLEFRYQERTANGETSRFHKFVERGSERH